MNLFLVQSICLEALSLAAGAGKLSFRRILIMVTFTVMGVRYFQLRYKRQRVTADEENKWIEAQYEKDENGLYPWEADTDESPERVTSDSKPMINSWGPKRGRWR